MGAEVMQVNGRFVRPEDFDDDDYGAWLASLADMDAERHGRICMPEYANKVLRDVAEVQGK